MHHQSDEANDKNKKMPKRPDIVCLGLDPGIVNHGIALAKSGPNGKIEVIATAMIHHPVCDFKLPIYKQIRRYLRQVQKFLDDHKVVPTILVGERFMGRGMVMKSQGELVALMLGAIATTYGAKTELKFIGAQQWKCQVNQMFDLKATYKQLPEGVTPHQIDSALMAIYGIELVQGKQHYSDFKGKYRILKLLRQIGEGSGG